MPSSYTAPNGKKKNGDQRFKADSKRYLYNIDTLWLNADSSNYDEVMEKGLLEKLIAGREFLLDTSEHQYIEIKIPGYERPLNFKVFPGDPPLYQYSIRTDDMAIYFSKKRRENQKEYPMRVQINQFILWEKGVEKAFNECWNVLKGLGFDPNGSKLNRVDFAVHSDQWQWNLKDLQKFEYPRNIADDNKPNFWRLDPETGEFETVYYGDRKRLQLRIYNKSKEVKRKKKQYFTDLYKTMGMDPDKVWNVEFEVRRPFIKEIKDYNEKPLFDDFEEVMRENRLADLWSFIMEKYTHGSEHWSYISTGSPFKGFYKVDGYEAVRLKDNDSCFEREVAQIAGRLKMAVINEEDSSFENAIEIFKKKYQEIEVEQKEKDWDDLVMKRKLSIHNAEINKTVKLNTLKTIKKLALI